MDLGLTLTESQSERAAIIACRDAGHDAADCPDVEQHTRDYARLMLAKHVEMAERQAAEEASRAALEPFDTN